MTAALTVSRKILGATFDNRDIQYALELPNFTNYRRNWEAQGLTHMPRRITRGGPQGPDHRIAHVYEYGLLIETQRGFSREVSSRMVYNGFKGMLRSGIDRFNKKSSEEKAAIYSTYEFTKDEDPWEFECFVRHPQIYFDDDFKSRDLENPQFWLFDFERDRTFITSKDETFAAGFTRLRDKDLSTFAYPDRVPRYSGFAAINVTDLLVRIDAGLSDRLLGREISHGGR